MEPLAFAELPEGALLLIDSAPIIYVLEAHPKFASRFGPLFEAHAAGRVRFAVTTITIAEVLTGPMKAGDEALARRYRAILESWRPIALDVDIAESAASIASVAATGSGRRRPKLRARSRSTPWRLSPMIATSRACACCVFFRERGALTLMGIGQAGAATLYGKGVDGSADVPFTIRSPRVFERD
jgi:hypothetical protein